MLYHSIDQTGIEHTDNLCSSLHKYGWRCHLLGQHAEAILAFNQCIPIHHDLLIKDQWYPWYLASSPHDMATSSGRAMKKPMPLSASAFNFLGVRLSKIVKLNPT